MTWFMKNVSTRQVVLLLAFVCLGGSLLAQSLGEVASRERARRPLYTRRSRVITNDDLQSVPALRSDGTANSRRARSSSSQPPESTDSTVAPEGDSRTAASSGSRDAGTADSKPPDEGPPSTLARDRKASAQQKVGDEWKRKIADQKSRIALLQRELDVTERESRMRLAVYYADAGTRLRDPGFDQQNLKDHGEIERKRAAVADATADLDRMMEDMRKAGVNSRTVE